jgi:hypothetical protein
VAAPAPALAPAPVPSAITHIVVRVDSKPSGAKVFVDGEQRGTTPTDLTFAPDATAVTIELRRRGYSTVEQTVTPDRDQRLMMSLTRSRSRAKPDDGDGYYRFD